MQKSVLVKKSGLFFSGIKKLYKKIWLPFWTLCVLDLLGYLLLSASSPTPMQHFLFMVAQNVIGMLLAIRHGKDVGRTIAQLYLLDALLAAIGFVLVFSQQFDSYLPAIVTIWLSATTGLSLCRIFAFVTMLGMPFLPSWPSLIPKVRFERDKFGVSSFDRKIRIAVVMLTLYGGVIVGFVEQKPFELLIILAPIVLLIFLIRAELASEGDSQETLSPYAVRFGRLFDELDPDLREAFFVTYQKSIRNVVDGAKKFAADAAAKEQDRDGPPAR